VTAILSSVGASKNAKRASIIHLYFNLIGTIVFMVVFYGWNLIAPFAFLDTSASAVDVAVIHSIFNVGCAVLMYPLSGLLVKLSIMSVPDKEGETEVLPQKNLAPEFAILDERFLNQPGFACELSMEAAKVIASTTKDCMIHALELLDAYSPQKAEKVRKLEETIDTYEDLLGTYLVKLSGKGLSQADSRSLSVILHCISDLERISDHAVNICDSIDEMRMQKQEFSAKARKELLVLTEAVRDIVSRSCDAFIANDLDGAKYVEPLEEVIDGLNVKLRQRHIDRLRAGKCTIELGIALEDIITNLERVSDHCSNIAVCMIQVSNGGFDTHEYLGDKVKHSHWFYEEVKKYSAVYTLKEISDIKDSDSEKKQTKNEKKNGKDDKKKSKKRKKE
ncbi:MAG: PhoU domain-containing protein, partial [bacterium]|nr:PhoU domain-containing protein [bacterium]